MRKEKSKKVFVGGRYDSRIFKGDFFNGMCLYDNKVDCYTLEETLNLPFIEGVVKWFNENDIEERNFNELSEQEKIEVILNYTQYDDIANIEYLGTEEEALKRKNELLSELNDIEEKIKTGEIVYTGQNTYEYRNLEEI